MGRSNVYYLIVPSAASMRNLTYYADTLMYHGIEVDVLCFVHMALMVEQFLPAYTSATDSMITNIEARDVLAMLGSPAREPAARCVDIDVKEDMLACEAEAVVSSYIDIVPFLQQVRESLSEDTKVHFSVHGVLGDDVVIAVDTTEIDPALTG